MSASEQESQGPVIRDRRRIDPVTREPRQAAAEPAQTGESAAQAGTASGQAPRGSGQARPGKHAVSKPGSPRQEAAGSGPPTPPSTASEASTASQAQEETDQPKSPDANGAPPADTTIQQTKGAEVAAMLAERTADLQRVQAEYANYRKRVERDRVAVREQALASVVSELVPVLDDIGRAREHEELTGGFKAVAAALESAATKLGLTTYGENGDPFDPNLHEGRV